MRTYSPFRYPGGKAKLYKQFHKLINENNLQNCTYVEPFCGGAGLAMKLLLRGDVSKIIINDIDPAIYAVWYCIFNKTEEFCNKIENIKISIEEREKQKEIYLKKDISDIFSLGMATLYLNRVNRSGILKAGVIGGKKQNGNYKMDCRFNKTKLIEIIRKIAEEKDNIEIYNMNAIQFLNKVKNEVSDNSLFYLDPPYYNQGSKLYTNFFSPCDHEILCNYVKNIKNLNWIVTYDNVPEIIDLYKDFNPQEYDITYTTEKKRKGKELLISNMDINFDLDSK